MADASVLGGMAALVTGGGSGIGLGCARRLVADGASVTICGRTEGRLRGAVETLESVAAPGAAVAWITCDVVDEAQVAAAVARAAEATGGLDVVVAAAGGSLAIGPLVSIPLEAWRATVDLNVTGTFLSIKHAAPVMARGRGGSIIAISSIASALTHRYLGAYCVGKAGIDTLVRVAADELGPSGIRVNSIRPGLVDTEMVEGITSTEVALNDYLDQMPLRRIGVVDDVAAAARYLAGPDSTWVTGQCLGVDGGHSLRRGPDYTPLVEPMFGADALRGWLPGA
jgi:NAD(P)-dependent dehydrogenase (short-subunit alcohol dehydrogenase family)